MLLKGKNKLKSQGQLHSKKGSNPVSPLRFRRPTGVGISLGLVLAGLGLARLNYATGISNVTVSIFNDFSTPAETQAGAFTVYGGKVSFLGSGISVDFAPHTTGNGLLVLNNVNGVDFSNTGGTAVHLSNPTSNPESISFELHDVNNQAVGIQATLPPNSSNDYVLVNNWASNGAAYGMSQLPPPYPGMINISAQGSSTFSWNKVQSAQIYALGPFPSDEVVNVSNVRLLQPYTMTQLLTGVCNQFGQTTLSQPENPISTPSDLVNELQIENAQLASGPENKNVDMYQGSLAMPAQTATGRFRLQQINGKWWFVDPLGHLFFATGIDQIALNVGQTIVQNRQYMFSGLPASTSPLAVNYGSTPVNGQNVQTYNFYASNLQQKFQTSNWLSQWQTMSQSRLLNWGFNCYGSYCDNVNGNGKLPYIASLSQRGNYATINTGNIIWGAVPDPFDPNFKASLISNMNSDDQAIKNDPFCYGVFSGIEGSWSGPPGPLQDYGVATGTLNMGPTSPAKMVFFRMVYGEYHRVQRLNAYWGTHFSSWAQFEQPFTVPASPSDWEMRDISKFTVAYFKVYFQTVDSVIKGFDPKLLDLGTEISTGHYTPYLMEGAQGVVDAMCMNSVTVAPDPTIMDNSLARNVPILTTELHFESPQSGYWAQTTATFPTEATRDQAMSTYMQTVLTNPMTIGANWYRYYDQNLVGDLYGAAGGDNYNVGLLDITDTPYTPLVNAFKLVHQNMYTTRWNS